MKTGTALLAGALLLAGGVVLLDGCGLVLGLGDFRNCQNGPIDDAVPCGGGGAGGAAPECDGPGDCPDPGAECKTRTCDNHRCGVAAVPAGTPISDQVNGDCKEVQCDGAGSTKVVDKDSDIEDDKNDCTADVCSKGAPAHPDEAARTPCMQDGGKMCNGQGACVTCTEGSDCPSTICQTGKCVAASCTDGVKNNDESDVDCGGSCGTCPDGDTCDAPTDCQGGACNSGVCCTPTTCAALALTCGTAPDGCGGMLDCDDAMKNGTETDVDCGGANCQHCGVGDKCNTGTDCSTPACANNVCCSTTCSGSCFSCATGTSGPGTCSPIPYMQTSPSCHTTNACDGAGNCKGLPGARCGMNADCFSNMCDTTKLAPLCK